MITKPWMGEDSPEQIEQCLNCKRQRCTNCIGTRSNANYGRKPVIASREGEEDLHFDSAADAGAFFHVSAQAIRWAINDNHPSQGYIWRYAE